MYFNKFVPVFIVFFLIQVSIISIFRPVLFSIKLNFLKHSQGEHISSSQIFQTCLENFESVINRTIFEEIVKCLLMDDENILKNFADVYNNLTDYNILQPPNCDNSSNCLDFTKNFLEITFKLEKSLLAAINHATPNKNPYCKDLIVDFFNVAGNYITNGCQPTPLIDDGDYGEEKENEKDDEDDSDSEEDDDDIINSPDVNFTS